MSRYAWGRGRAPRPRELLAAGLPLAVAGLLGVIAVLILGGVQ